MRSDPPHLTVNHIRADLCERFQGPLMTFFLRRSKSYAEAEDLTQEVLLRVLGAAEVEPSENPDRYIFKIAANLLRDERRQAQRNGSPTFVPIEDALAGELARQLVEDSSPERVLLNRDSLIDALRTLDELGERTRDIFILFRLEAMKQKDIAELLGIGQSTVEKHVMRAVLHLMNRYGGPREEKTHGRD